MTLNPPKNANYSAVVVRVPRTIELPNCDNVHAVPIFGSQAITQKSVQEGDLMLYFPAEVQLSPEYCRVNNMYRHSELNADPEIKGYIEDNRRVKAMKFRGHRSDALLMPISSLSFITQKLPVPPPGERYHHEGDTFDEYHGVEICRKYVPAGLKEARPGAEKTPRLSLKSFPEHLDTDNYWRNAHKIRPEAGPLTVTQKLHGTSGRWGRVLVDRKLSFWERLAKRLGIKVQEQEYQLVAGSRRVVKGVSENEQHFYDTDLWSVWAAKIGGLIPDGFIVYGEIIGWTPEGSPIQPNYTYDLPKGQNELYVYRVARIDERGLVTDLSWPAVKDFCRDRGLKWVPGVDHYGSKLDLEEMLNDTLDRNFARNWAGNWIDGTEIGWYFAEQPVPLSDPKSPDEGYVVRQDGRELLLLKAKSPLFLRGESKALDKGEVGIEELEAA